MLVLQVLLPILLLLFILYSQILPEDKLTEISPRVYLVGFVSILMLAILTRVIGLDVLPYGINQDEAAAAYDGWALAHYGIDRNAYTFPILPKSWGDGAGGFYFYVMMVVSWIVPITPWTLRLPNALLHIASIAAFADLLRRTKGERVALLGMLFLTISPWHIMLSRWALDANQVFGLTLFGVYFSYLGTQKHAFKWHILAMFFYALAMYSYGSGIIVVPFIMMAVYGEMLWKQRIKWKQVLILVGQTFVINAPLLAFYFINIFKLPEYRGPLFSLPRFTALRSVAVMIPLDQFFWSRMEDNFYDLLKYITVGYPDWPWNQLEGFSIFFEFTFPLFLIGIYLIIKYYKQRPMIDHTMLFWFIAAAIFTLFLHQRIQRMAILFVPLIYFHAIGMEWLLHSSKWLGRASISLIVVAFGIFGYYYTTRFNDTIRDGFSQGYVEAVRYAEALDKDELHLPPHPMLNGGDVMMLYALQPDPNAYLYDRGDYWDDQPAFALYFMHEGMKIVLEPLGEIETVEPTMVYVIKTQDAWRIKDQTATRIVFTHFTVIYHPD